MDSFPPKNGPSTAPYIQHQFHSEPPKKRSLGIHLDRFLRLRSDPDCTQLEPKPLNVRFWFTVGASLLAGYLVGEYSAYWMYRVMRIHPNDVTYSDLSLVVVAIAGATLFTFLALSSIRNPGVKAAKTHHVC